MKRWTFTGIHWGRSFSCTIEKMHEIAWGYQDTAVRKHKHIMLFIKFASLHKKQSPEIRKRHDIQQ